MILIVFSHPYPQRSHANKAIIKHIANTKELVIDDLYQKYPDFHINVQQEQALLRQAELIIFQFPVYCYNIPALLKQWQEMVLTKKFSLGDDKKSHTLQGKASMAVVTAGHKYQSYQKGGFNNYTLEDFLRPLEQMSVHSGMDYHSPLALYQAHRATEEELIQFSQSYARRIEQLYQQITHNNE